MAHFDGCVSGTWLKDINIAELLDFIGEYYDINKISASNMHETIVVYESNREQLNKERYFNELELILDSGVMSFKNPVCSGLHSNSQDCILPVFEAYAIIEHRPKEDYHFSEIIDFIKEMEHERTNKMVEGWKRKNNYDETNALGKIIKQLQWHFSNEAMQCSLKNNSIIHSREKRKLDEYGLSAEKLMDSYNEFVSNPERK